MTTVTDEIVLPEKKAHLALLTAGLIALAIFTIFITWRAGRLEMQLVDENERPALVNHVAPDFSGATLDGRTVSLADFHGQKNLVVAFWATWCAPCRLEMPALKKFYKLHHTPSSDFEMLAISIDDDPKDASDFRFAEKLDFPVMVDIRRRIASSYGVDAIPTMFIIDKTGRVIYGSSGYDATMNYWLAQKLGIKLEKGGGSADDSSN